MIFNSTMAAGKQELFSGVVKFGSWMTELCTAVICDSPGFLLIWDTSSSSNANSATIQRYIGDQIIIITNYACDISSQGCSMVSSIVPLFGPSTTCVYTFTVEQDNFEIALAAEIEDEEE